MGAPALPARQRDRRGQRCAQRDGDRRHQHRSRHSGTRRLYELMASERGVSATVIQTVGSKGYDGFAVALVTADR